MTTIKKFEDIGSWRKARSLSDEVYNISIGTGLAKDFRLRDQVNAASGSSIDNIAEGFERGGKAEFIHFLTIAKGSCAEVNSQLYRLFDRKYIDEIKFNNCINSVTKSVA